MEAAQTATHKNRYMNLIIILLFALAYSFKSFAAPSHPFDDIFRALSMTSVCITIIVNIPKLADLLRRLPAILREFFFSLRAKRTKRRRKGE